MTVLGIDPGSVVIGYGLVESSDRRDRLVEAGSIKPSTIDPFEQRLLEIHDRFIELVHRLRPSVVAVESAFGGANVQTLMKMCHARGTILTALARAKVPLFEYAPREVKKSVVGNGNASKQQVKFMVQKLVGEGEVDDQPLDVTDAVAVALCHLHGNGRLAPEQKGGPSSTVEERLIAVGVDPAQARRYARSGR